MSGSTSYTVVLTPEQEAAYRARLALQLKEAAFQKLLNTYRQNNAELQRMLNDENSELRRTAREQQQEKLRAHDAQFVISSIGTDLSEYKGEYIPTEKELAQQKLNAYSEVLRDYAQACAVLGREMDDCFQYDEERCDELIEQLQQETERLKELRLQQMKNEFIYENSVKVLEEMGYKLVGDHTIIKKSGAMVKSTLLKLDEKTAVNLVSTQDGQYTFELVGVTQEGHKPTEEELENLFRVMGETCEFRNTEYQRRMKEHGCIMENINIRPLDRSVCRTKELSKYEKAGKADRELIEAAEQRMEQQNG